MPHYVARALRRARLTREYEAEGDGTRLTEHLETASGMRGLREILAYRQRQAAGDLAAQAWAAGHGHGPRTIAVTGASGLVGSALCAFLTAGGHRVIRLVRRPASGPQEREWDPARPDPALLEGVDALVHLAGASIAGRFTAAHRRAIEESRVQPTRALCELAATTAHGPRTLVIASAIGFYGADPGERPCTEDAPPGDDFLARVVAAWEAAADPARQAGLRVVHVRTGIVQASRGGTLRLLLPLYRLGAGGPLAGGSQWMSWIGLDDLVDVYHRALLEDTLAGSVNAVAPWPVRGADYARVLGRVLSRPAVLPVPRQGPRLLLGVEGSRELVEASQKVAPRVLRRLGHAFRHPTLESCLRHELGRTRRP